MLRVCTDARVRIGRLGCEEGPRPGVSPARAGGGAVNRSLRTLVEANSSPKFVLAVSFLACLESPEPYGGEIMTKVSDLGFLLTTHLSAQGICTPSTHVAALEERRGSVGKNCFLVITSCRKYNDGNSFAET